MKTKITKLANINQIEGKVGNKISVRYAKSGSANITNVGGSVNITNMGGFKVEPFAVVMIEPLETGNVFSNKEGSKVI